MMPLNPLLIPCTSPSSWRQAQPRQTRISTLSSPRTPVTTNSFSKASWTRIITWLEVRWLSSSQLSSSKSHLPKTEASGSRIRSCVRGLRIRMQFKHSRVTWRNCQKLTLKIMSHYMKASNNNSSRHYRIIEVYPKSKRPQARTFIIHSWTTRAVMPCLISSTPLRIISLSQRK